MSRVTNVILTIFDGVGHDGLCEGMKELNDWCADNLNRQTFSRRIEECGGHKRLEMCIYLAAFNHIHAEDIYDKVKAIRWEYPESLVMMVCREEDDKFTVMGKEKNNE